MKYGFWKLLRAQYSWYNDRVNILVAFGIATLWVVVSHLTGNLSVEPVEYYWAGLFFMYAMVFIYVYVVYNMLKLVCMFIFCYCVSSLSKKGNFEAIDTYNQALTWRQKKVYNKV